MSKKKKFKKNFRSEIFNQLKNNGLVDSTSTSNPQSQQNDQIDNTVKPQSLDQLKDHHVAKKDLLRIVWIMVLVLLILLVIVILNAKTNYISDFANQISNFSHLNK